MTKYMIVDTLEWFGLVFVLTVSFSIAIYQMFQYGLDYPELNECDADAFGVSLTHHVPRMLITYLGGEIIE